MTGYIGASFMPVLFNLIANPWIARNMSPEDYAITGFYSSFSSLLTPIIGFYMVNYYIKDYFRLDEPERNRLFSMVARALIVFSGIVSVVCCGVLFIYLYFIRRSDALPISPYLFLSVFSIPLTGLFLLQLADYKVKRQAGKYFNLSIAVGLLSTCISVLMVVVMHLGAFGKLAAVLIANLLSFTYLFLKLRKRMAVKVPFANYVTLIRFCFPLALSAVFGYFTNGYTTTFLERSGNNTEYGIYVVGIQIGAYLMVFASAVSSTFQPDLFDAIYKADWRRYFKFCSLQFLTVAATVTLFILLAPFVVSILTGGAYTESAPYSRIMALCAVTSTLYYLSTDFTIAKNKPRLFLYTSLIGSALVVILTPVFVHRWEYFGGVWMNVVSYLIFFLINLLLLWISLSTKKNLNSKSEL